MSRSSRSLAGLALGLALAAGCVALAAGCAARARPPSPPLPGPLVPILGTARLTAAQLTAWFEARTGATAAYRASVPVARLARHYIDEGEAEGIAGDVAFVQAILETGWFRFQGQVAPGQNNFAGLGATGGAATPAAFPDARTGVRAQIQHLRAYADPTATACDTPPLHHPCADPRFHLVAPKGRARTWNDLGRGNWATSPTYGSSILHLYRQALAHAARH